MVFAATLIEGDGFLWNVECTVAQALFDVDKHVGEVASAGHHVFSCVRALAGGILAHVNHGGLWRGALELDDANDRFRSSRINRSCWSRPGRGGGGGCCGVRSFLFSAARQTDKAQ